MTLSQHTPDHARPLRGLWSRAAKALRDIHKEQVLMWELFWQAGRVPVERAGPLAWVPSLDGPRLTGSHLPGPEDAARLDGP